MNKDTARIVEELKLSEDFNTFYKENFDYMATEPLSVLLEDLLKKKDLKKAQVIKNSEIAETYAYQIFSGLRVPERNKLLCIAVGMGLNIDEVQLLLKTAGYPVLYVKKPFDSIILYGICKNLNVVEINDLLYDYGFETIG